MPKCVVVRAAFLTDDKVSRKKKFVGCYVDPLSVISRSFIGLGPLYILDPSLCRRRPEFRLKRFRISVGCVPFSSCVERWIKFWFEFGLCCPAVGNAGCAFPKNSRESGFLSDKGRVISCLG